VNTRSWETLVDMIDQKFSVTEHKKITEPLPDNPRLTRLLDIIYFTKSGLSYKVVRTTQPSVSDTKTHYTHRGSASRIEHQYDETDTVSHVTFYEGAGTDEWREVQAEGLLV